MTFKMVWKSTGEPVKYEDAAKHFRFTGTRADGFLHDNLLLNSA